MGKQKDMIFVGSAANLVFYEWKGIPVIRTKASNIKQTTSTIQQSSLFGIASHTGAKLRSLLQPALPDAKNRNMMRRFEQAIVGWLRAKGAESSTMQANLPFITGFECNEAGKLNNRLKLHIPVTVNAANNPVITLPDMVPVRDINAPAHTVSVCLQVQAGVCSLQNDDYNNSAGKSFNIMYTNDLISSQIIEFPFQIAAGCIAVVVVSLSYTIPKTSGPVMVKDKRWQPAAVVGAVWGGL